MARKTALLIRALSVAPIVFAYRVESLWGAVLLIGRATAAHQEFSASLFTLTSDLFPAQAVGSVMAPEEWQGYRGIFHGQGRGVRVAVDGHLHGGRQLDGASATLRVLREIVAAVGIGRKY